MNEGDWFDEQRHAELFVWTCPICGKIGIGADFRISHVTSCVFSMNK